MAILPHYFNKRLSLANGIANALSAIIVVILPVLTSKIIHSYSLVGLFYFLSGLNLLTVIMAFTYRPLIRNDKNLTKIQRLKNSFGISVLKKKGFVVWCIASFIACFGWLIPIVVIVIRQFYFIYSLMINLFLINLNILIFKGSSFNSCIS